MPSLSLGTALPVTSGGTGVTTSTGSGANVLGTSPTLTGTPVAPTATVGTNTTQIATTAFVTSAVQAAYPVGSIYMNASNSTNPATLLGFGTWTATGQGRMLLGTDNSTYTAGTTGGSATTTISSGNLPAHDHSITDPGHFHTNVVSPNPDVNNFTGPGDRGNLAGQTTTAVTGITKTNTTQGNGSLFSNTAMTTISPYLVVYMWVRTA